MEQRNATIAILSALTADLAVKGSKRKRIDHWKGIACASAGVSKMGSARYQKIIDYGIQNGFWEIELVGARQKPTLKPLTIQTPAPAQTAPAPETEEVVVSQRERTTPAVEVRLPHPHQEIAELPRKGDLYYYQSYQGGKVQGEVLSVYAFADVVAPDGGFQTVALCDLSDTKRGVKKGEAVSAWTQDNRTLRAERDQLLREIERLKSQRDALEQ